MKPPHAIPLTPDLIFVEPGVGVGVGADVEVGK